VTGEFTSLSQQRFKVAVWATGGVGRFAIRTIVDRPNMELVGGWVHSSAKNGKDLGELAGIDPVGVVATQDADELLSSDIDCVMYAAPAGPRPKEALRDYCRILAAGKNVVTTALPGLVYEKGSLSERFLQPIREAAEAGSSSIFSSGIEPGFGCDLFPIALMTMSHKVYSVRGIEITNYSRYPVEFDVRELFGFGQPLDYSGGLRSPGVLRWGWGAAVTMVADALGVELDEIRETCEFQATPGDLESAVGIIKAGTVGATYARCIGVVDGVEVITIEHVDRMADDLALDWPTGRTGGTDGLWRVIIDGEPSFDGEFEVGSRQGENSSEQGLLATGMRAVNAIPWVCTAAPGIVDALHLPLTTPLGALHPHRDGVPAF
jgi:2,4-diaminopentanoate dehydrogenase